MLAPLSRPSPRPGTTWTFGCWPTRRTRTRAPGPTCGAGRSSTPSPRRCDQIARRKAKGSKGGRPPGFDRELYKLRNTVERSFNRFKQWRGLATRYDKYAVTYLGGVLLGLIVLTHRAKR